MRTPFRLRPAARAAVGLVLMLLAGCGGGDSGPGAQVGSRRERPAAVSVAVAAAGSIASRYEASATLEAEKEAEVLARVEGMAGALSCEEGDDVREGQPLLVIDNDAYGLRLRQAEAATARLRSRFRRLSEMREQDLTTEEEYETARSELADAEAQEGLARLDVSYTTVRAPFAGRVTRRLVDVGQNVAAGSPLFAIADLTPLLARVHVPAKEFRSLRPGQAVDLVLDSDGRALSGRIELVSPVIDPTSGTIKVTIGIPEYPEGIRPGDFAQVRIETERRDGVLLVPRAAVVADKGETVVFVAADGRAERRVVAVGFTEDDRAEILSGLAAGERVVVRGQRSLKDGDPVSVTADGAAAPDTTAAARGGRRGGTDR